MALKSSSFFLDLPGSLAVPKSNNVSINPPPRPNQDVKFDVQCSGSSKVIDQSRERRSANYQPTVWSYDVLQSIKIDEDEWHKERAKLWEENVRNAINRVENANLISTLILIDEVQRLGLGYRFKEDIKGALYKYVVEASHNENGEQTLYTTALSFRLLRQHGFKVSQDVFKCFLDHEGNIWETLHHDTKGMLSLFEASHFAFVSEDILHKIKSTVGKHLKALGQDVDKNLEKLVSHELDLPQHHRMSWYEARWYIEVYNENKDANLSLLKLAISDFNMVQSILRDDLQEMSRWWNSINLARKLNFARDRLMECFFWTVGMTSDPHLSNCRKGLTKVTSFITVIDDIYDVYGTLDELELFTNAVQRWDVSAMQNLPNYMKLCFLALYNSVNEMAYDILKEKGVNIIPCLTKAWADLCKTFLQEANWSHQKITPTFEDYMNNGWISVSGPLILIHAYVLSSQNINEDTLKSLENYHDLLHWPSTIFRLCNDLATSSAEIEMGETANSILCYMREKRVSEKTAREKIKEILDEAWKKLNEYQVNDSEFTVSFIQIAFNLARISHYTYQHGDSHGAPDSKSKNRIKSLILEPISIENKLLNRMI